MAVCVEELSGCGSMLRAVLVLAAIVHGSNLKIRTRLDAIAGLLNANGYLFMEMRPVSACAAPAWTARGLCVAKNPSVCVAR
jgi:hypothetical protein